MASIQRLYYSFVDWRLVPLQEAAPEEIVAFQARNREYFRTSMPERDAAFYTTAFWQAKCAAIEQEFLVDRAIRFAITAKDSSPTAVVGIINFDQISRGAFQACFLGFQLDQSLVGQSVMSRSLRAAIPYVTTQRGLNRIMASYLPENYRSARLLKRLGFEREGYARRYLHLNGAWRDMILSSYVAPVDDVVCPA